jgi:hypothetical protein
MYILKIIMLCSVVLLSGHLCAFGGGDEKFRLQANRAVCSLVNYRPTGYRIVLELSDVVIPPLIELLLLRK